MCLHVLVTVEEIVNVASGLWPRSEKLPNLDMLVSPLRVCRIKTMLTSGCAESLSLISLSFSREICTILELPVLKIMLCHLKWRI